MINLRVSDINYSLRMINYQNQIIKEKPPFLTLASTENSIAAFPLISAICFLNFETIKCGTYQRAATISWRRLFQN